MSSLNWHGYTACPMEHFRCDDDLPPSASNCVPFNVTCDRYPHCPEGQDENSELCQGRADIISDLTKGFIFIEKAIKEQATAN